MILRGDCIKKLRDLKANSVDAIVTDPPYGWRFMGKAWDGADIEKMALKDLGRAGELRMYSDGRMRRRRLRPAQSAGKYDLSVSANKAFEVWTEEWAREALRVLKPGGHMVVFCGPRTYHRMASGVENAGFEIRDQLQWIFGSGFPKSLNVGKHAGKNWQGWGTALKPANEPIVLARKPLEKGLTVAQNVLKWGTGGLNIDDCRIGTETRSYSGGNKLMEARPWTEAQKKGDRDKPQFTVSGRFPANLLLDETAAEMLDGQSGNLHGAGNKRLGKADNGERSIFGIGGRNGPTTLYDRGGGASRFFYVAKASRRERNAGLEGMPAENTYVRKGANNPSPNRKRRKDSFRQNSHPTVKPVRLMEYLIRLVTPKGGTVLDPFLGSGTTGVAAKKLGFKFIGIEKEKEYAVIAKARLSAAA